jgi:hypothetical protein
MDFNDINITAESKKKEEVKSLKHSKKNDESQEEQSKHAIQPKYNIDETISRIINESGLPEGKQKFDPKKIHSMNLEFKDDYIDDDDPGFDTYVVNEENFVSSCQELASLNDFPERSIAPDTKHDMAFRERYRKE